MDQQNTTTKKERQMERLRRRGLKLRYLASLRGLKMRDIAEDLQCSEDLVSKAFLGQRPAALGRVEEYLKTLPPIEESNSPKKHSTRGRKRANGGVVFSNPQGDRP